MQSKNEKVSDLRTYLKIVDPELDSFDESVDKSSSSPDQREKERERENKYEMEDQDRAGEVKLRENQPERARARERKELNSSRSERVEGKGFESEKRNIKKWLQI